MAAQEVDLTVYGDGAVGIDAPIGHSQMRGWILGGMAGDLLDHVPVLSLMPH